MMKTSKITFQEVLFLKQCLQLYECDSGQKINFQKSALSFGLGVRNEDKARLQSILGVPIVAFHEKYLGLPTMSGKNKNLMFKSIQERLHTHMKGWQSKFCPKLGRLSLLRQWRGNSDIFYECFKITKRCLQSFSNQDC